MTATITKPLRATRARVRDLLAQQTAVVTVGTRALASTPVQDVLTEAVSVVRDTVHADYCGVLGLTAEGNDLVPKAAVGSRDVAAVAGAAAVIVDAERRPWGVLGAYTGEPHVFTREDMHFLQSVADLLSAAVQREQATRHTLHDLRNALSTIQMCATALVDAQPPPGRDVRQVAELLQRSVMWMRQVVQERFDPATKEDVSSRSA
jgi:hypothetical protein